MEKGAKAILIILAASLLLGALVILVNPLYRQTAKHLVNGTIAESPIWQSNKDYYPEITPSAEGETP